MIKPLIIFYIVIYALILFVGMQRMILYHNDARVTSSGIEISTAVFIFVVGLNSFKSTFHLFLANGVSRKTMFKSYILAIVPLAAFMAFVDIINNVVLSSVDNYQSMFYQMYNLHYGPVLNFGAQMRVALDGFVWMTFLYIALALLGFFITAIYYRMGKSLKLIVSIGVPVFFVMLLPYMDTYLFDGKVFDALGYFFSKAWGFLDGYNPYVSVLSSFITAVVFGALSFLAIRRATVKI